MSYLKFIIVFLLPINIFAGLTFTPFNINDSITAETLSYDFKFPFKNTGEHPVKITKITSSCGCTVAKNDKEMYEPNESGEIKGTFTIGDRIGIQENYIYVETDDLSQSKVKLTLKINILKDIEVKPALLLWKSTEAPVEKIVKFTVNSGKFLSAETDDPNFKVAEPTQEKKENSFSLKVLPTSTAESKRAILKMKYKNNAGVEKFTIVHLLIK